MKTNRRAHASYLSESGVGLKLFSQDALEHIHLASLEMLERTGIWVEDDDVLDILSDGGCRVDRETHIVKIPPHVVADALVATPSRMTIAARDPQKDLVLESNRVYFETGQFGTQVLDPETGERRVATLQDNANTARLADALGDIDLFMPPVMPSDCEGAMGLRLYRDALVNSTMAIHVGPYDPAEAEPLVKMASIVFGDAVRDRPPLVAAFCFRSPLALPKMYTDMGIPAARAGLPVQLNSMPVVGSSGPGTLAGSLTLQNAECLAMISLAQLVRRGTAVLYSSMVQSFDMKTAMVASGSPETAILQCGAAQLCQHYNIPSYVIPGWTESKVSDAQAGHENTLGLLTSAMTGANVVSGAGMLETGLTFSPGHLVVCNEIAAMARKFIEGIAVSDETLLVDAVDEVGIGKAYLSHESTRAYARSGSQPKLLDRRPYADWQADGAADLASRANAEAIRLIAEHEVEPLPEEIVAQLDAVIAEAEATMEPAAH